MVQASAGRNNKELLLLEVEAGKECFCHLATMLPENEKEGRTNAVLAAPSKGNGHCVRFNVFQWVVPGICDAKFLMTWGVRAVANGRFCFSHSQKRKLQTMAPQSLFPCGGRHLGAGS